MQRRFHVLTGPTAAGKTDFLLGQLPAGSAVVVSADSRQVYRLMDIGTGKPSRDELDLLPHYGLDILDLGTKFSVYQFLICLAGWLRQLADDPRELWICGGTGLYIHALLERMTLGAPPRQQLRLALAAAFAERSAQYWSEALQLSPPDPHNPVRVLRAAEAACVDPVAMQRIYARLGLDPTVDDAGNAAEHDQFLAALEVLDHWQCAGIAVLDPGRDELLERITQRVGRMFEQGLPEEVQRIRDAGFAAVDEVASGIAYREAGLLLDGALAYEAAVEQAIIRTRQYAKRQRTYFRGRGWAFMDDAELLGWFNSRQRS